MLTRHQRGPVLKWRTSYDNLALQPRRVVTRMRARMVGRENYGVRSGTNRTIGGFAILALLAATLSAVADVYPGATSSSPAQRSSLSKSMRKNLPHFGEATTTLYRGGQPSQSG